MPNPLRPSWTTFLQVLLSSTIPRSLPKPTPSAPVTPSSHLILCHLQEEFMSQWNQVQQLESTFLEQIDQIYDDKFPMEVRHLLAQWIENQDWESAYSNEPMATLLLQNLLIKLDEHLDRVSQEKNLLLIHNLKRIRKVLQGKYQSNPMHIAVVVSNCLREERRVLASASMPVQMTEQDVKYLEDLQEEFDFRFKTIHGMEKNDKNSVVMKQEMLMLQEMLNTLDYRRKEVLAKMAQIIKEVEDLLNNMLIEELLEWKRRQQIACIGGPLHRGLDQLQNCFTLYVAFCILSTICPKAPTMGVLNVWCNKYPKIAPDDGDAFRLCTVLMKRFTSFPDSSFIVERQPCMPTHPQRPLVLKTLIQFTVKLRLLIKLPELTYQIKVKATIDNNRRFVLCGTHVKAMNMDESTNGSLSVEFRHLQPKEMKTCSGNKGNEVGRNHGLACI
ncbi:Signal transducer and activator of transcription 4 [Varanus komodoensis]|nr:Signal transducer and activator of transcription 4 [Varanus komodoensis]